MEHFKFNETKKYVSETANELLESFLQNKALLFYCCLSNVKSRTFSSLLKQFIVKAEIFHIEEFKQKLQETQTCKQASSQNVSDRLYLCARLNVLSFGDRFRPTRLYV